MNPARTAFAATAIALLTGCAFGGLPHGYQSFKPRIVGEQPSGDKVGDSSTPSEIDNSGRYGGDGGKAGRSNNKNHGEGGEVAKPSVNTPAPAPAPTPAPAPVVTPPTLDLNTIIEALGSAWQSLKRPQPIDPAIGKFVDGFGAAISAIQHGFDMNAAREANRQIEAIRATMGPGETKHLHIHKDTNGDVKVFVVPNANTPVLKSPGQQSIDWQISTPEVIIYPGTGLRSMFRSKESVLRESKKRYDAEWAAYYQQANAEIERILTPAGTR